VKETDRFTPFSRRPEQQVLQMLKDAPKKKEIEIIQECIGKTKIITE
jgi:hypothetical protein